MIPTPGRNAHVAAVIKSYLAFTEAVRLLVPDLSVDHTGDIAARLAEIDPRLVREPDRLPAVLKKLRVDDPFLFEREPLGQHVVRLVNALHPGRDLGSLRAAVDRMYAEGKRRCAYAAKRALIAEGKSIPEPRDTDGNICQGAPGNAPSTPHRRFRDGQIAGTPDAAQPDDLEDRDTDRAPHMQLQPMRKRIARA